VTLPPERNYQYVHLEKGPKNGHEIKRRKYEKKREKRTRYKGISPLGEGPYRFPIKKKQSESRSTSPLKTKDPKNKTVT